MTDLKLAAQKALAELEEIAEWATTERAPLREQEVGSIRGVVSALRSALQHQEEREPVLFYAFKHNWGNGKIGWTFHTPEEQATAYRDTCLEIIPLGRASIEGAEK